MYNTNTCFTNTRNKIDKDKQIELNVYIGQIKYHLQTKQLKQDIQQQNPNIQSKFTKF